MIFKGKKVSGANSSLAHPPTLNTSAVDIKLKYLAHSHHPVSMVGKIHEKNVDLNAIQQQIDNAKSFFLENDDDDGLNLTAKDKRSLDYGNDPFEDVISKSKKRKPKKKPPKKPAKGNPEDSPKVSEFTDFDEIQLNLTPEQADAINTFSQNLQESPRPFHFDIQEYLKPKPVEFKMALPLENPSKKYFEFDESDEDRKETTETDAVEKDEPEKRSVNTRFEAYRNLVREQQPMVAYDVDGFHANCYRKQLEEEKREQQQEENLFQGEQPEPKEEKTQKNDHRALSPADLAIDLRLDHEFQDLQFEKDKVLHRGTFDNDGNERPFFYDVR